MTDSNKELVAVGSGHFAMGPMPKVGENKEGRKEKEGGLGAKT